MMLSQPQPQQQPNQAGAMSPMRSTMVMQELKNMFEHELSLETNLVFRVQTTFANTAAKAYSIRLPTATPVPLLPDVPLTPNCLNLVNSPGTVTRMLEDSEEISSL